MLTKPSLPDKRRIVLLSTDCCRRVKSQGLFNHSRRSQSAGELSALYLGVIVRIWRPLMK